ncbi:MAG: iron chelate uptake ABC transporter family permease subunit [Thermoguttaceae bacterium]|nr:iron chelate uptake ABC transporter family permease subunit [Thermoguttaceae bacterium]
MTSRVDDAPILKVERLGLSLEGVDILRGVSFQVARGSRVALVGANGAGKTSALRCVSRVVENWTGRIELDGVDVRALPRRELARRVAVVRQIQDYCEAYLARQIVEFGRSPRLRPLEKLSARDDAIVRDALERTGSVRFAERRFDSLSGGERQKILVAAAFAQEPELLLLDEPTTFLDYRAQREISDSISEWLRDKGASALEATHDLNRAVLLADEIVALNSGNVAFLGSPNKATEREALSIVYGFAPTTVPHPSVGIPMIVPDPPGRLDPVSDPEAPKEIAPELPRQRQATARGLALFALVALAVLIVLPLLGRTTYGFDVWARFPTANRPILSLDALAKIFWGERLPKTALAALAGAGLALAGLTMQTLFRNALATPYTLGVAGGASLGATLTLVGSAQIAALGIPSALLGAPLIVWGSGLGAFLATALVYGLSKRAVSNERILLSGAAVGFFFSSLVLCAQYLANPAKTFVALRWTIGGFDLCEPSALALVGATVLATGLCLFCYSRSLDALTLGDERAKTLGVDAEKTRRLLFALCSALVGVVVAFCGPIGFVGLVVPHVARLFVGNARRVLVPASALGGALFLATCHTASRIVVYPSVLPVGIVTSLLGAPFFLWLLSRSRR